jgi:excisionase family DNA binding protein
MAIDSPALLRPEETAEMLGISRSKTYSLLAAGELPSVRVGRSVRVNRKALMAWIDRNTTRDPSDAGPDR